MMVVMDGSGRPFADHHRDDAGEPQEARRYALPSFPP